MHKFDPMHVIEIRTPYDVKLHGQADKPYVLSWDYPVWIKGQYLGPKRRHMTATVEKAMEFALKHRIPRDRLPPALRKRLCDLARTARAIASTSTAPCDTSSAPSV